MTSKSQEKAMARAAKYKQILQAIEIAMARAENGKIYGEIDIQIIITDGGVADHSIRLVEKFR